MATGVTLGALVDQLRKEVSDSTNAAHGANTVDHYKHLLRRTQQALYDDHGWPHLQVKRFVQPQAGTNIYAFPNDMKATEVTNVYFKSGTWRPLSFGIGIEEYNIHDSDADERDAIIQKWDFSETDQFEVWPVPSQLGNTTTKEGMLRLDGKKSLSALVSESDTADLDDQLIVLNAAIEILTKRKSKEADVKAERARARFVTLRGRYSKNKKFSLNSESDDEDSGVNLHAVYNDRTP